MKNLKRALSLALSTVMLMGMMVVGTGASYADVTSDYNKEAIEVLQEVGVMVGDNNGNFNPEAPVTRQEMAVIMCNLLDYTVSSYKGTAPFTDVDDWAADYVAACYTNEIIKGISDTEFGGKQGVTTGQAALMLMKALGYFQYQTDFGQDWLVATTKQGSQIGLFDDIDTGAREALTRNDVAQMVLNALQADMVEYAGGGTVIETGDVIINTGKSLYNPRTGTASKYSTIGRGDNIIQLGEDLYGGKLVLDEDAADDLGRPADAWYYKGNEIGTYTDDADDIMVFDDHGYDLEYMLTDKDYFNFDDSKGKSQSSDEADLDGNETNKFLNGCEAKKASEIALVEGDIVEVYKDKYGFVTDVVVIREDLAVIDKVDTSVSSSDEKNGVYAYVDLEDLGGTAVYDGTYNDDDIPGFDADTYTEGTVIGIVVEYTKLDGTNEGEIIASEILTEVKGQVSAYKSNDTVTIDGTKYNIAKYADEQVTDYSFNDKDYVAYIGSSGYVLGTDGVNVLNIEDIYYVNGVYFDADSKGNVTYYAEVVDSEGAIKEVKLEKTAFLDTLNKDNALENGIKAPTAKKFYDIDKLYELTDKDTCKVNEKNFAGNTATAKASSNNGKFDLKEYTGKGDYGVYGPTLKDDLKKTDESAKIGGKSVYLDDETQYIVMDGAGDGPDVYAYVGGVNFEKHANSIAWVITEKEGTASVAKYVFLSDDDVNVALDPSSVVYVASDANTEVEDGWEADLYFMDGTMLEDVTVDIQIVDNEGFYTYELKDGVYELDRVTDRVYGLDNGNFDYDDESGALVGAQIEELFRNALTLYDYATDKGHIATFEGVSLSDKLQIVDTRTNSEIKNDKVYDIRINNRSKLESAMDKGTVIADIYFDDGEVVLIAVRSIGGGVMSATVVNVGAEGVAFQENNVNDGTITMFSDGTTPAGSAKLSFVLPDGSSITNATVAGEGAVSVTRYGRSHTETVTLKMEKKSGTDTLKVYVDNAAEPAFTYTIEVAASTKTEPTKVEIPEQAEGVSVTETGDNTYAVAVNGAVSSTEAVIALTLPAGAKADSATVQKWDATKKEYVEESDTKATVKTDEGVATVTLTAKAAGTFQVTVPVTSAAKGSEDYVYTFVVTESNDASVKSYTIEVTDDTNDKAEKSGNTITITANEIGTDDKAVEATLTLTLNNKDAKATEATVDKADKVTLTKTNLSDQGKLGLKATEAGTYKVTVTVTAADGSTADTVYTVKFVVPAVFDSEVSYELVAGKDVSMAELSEDSGKWTLDVLDYTENNTALIVLNDKAAEDHPVKISKAESSSSRLTAEKVDDNTVQLTAKGLTTGATVTITLTDKDGTEKTVELTVDVTNTTKA